MSPSLAPAEAQREADVQPPRTPDGQAVPTEIIFVAPYQQDDLTQYVRASLSQLGAPISEFTSRDVQEVANALQRNPHAPVIHFTPHGGSSFKALLQRVLTEQNQEPLNGNYIEGRTLASHITDLNKKFPQKKTDQVVA